MARSLYLVIALVCYAAFFAAFVYLIGFVAAYPALPTHVDKGFAAPPATAALIDLALIALFGVQHSVMARPGFKARWTKIVPQPIERSVYCLAAAGVLFLLYAFWHPIGGTVWDVTDPTGRTVLWALFALGWVIVFISTWLISHFELFGLAQVWRFWQGSEAPAGQLTTPAFYRVVRHPIYSGFLLAFWATPTMSYGHLLLAAAMTVYVLIAIGHEERDLVGVFGDDYVAYRKRVGMLVPGVGKRG
ncbi:MAG: isoprenylcysteine carboxylmethyltransferase family protein [Novosphingobium sp.]|nr:isoprenylcysteine carboxylmethyltransferase family protein [Novosphingobium sp.]